MKIVPTVQEKHDQCRILFLALFLSVALTLRAEAVCFVGGEGRADAAGATMSLVGLSIDSAADQTFLVSDAATLASLLDIMQGSTSVGSGVLAVKDLRVIIPSTLQMVWDNSVDTASVTMSTGATGSVDSAVTYENGNKTVVLNVTADFADSDDVTVSGLRLKTFSQTTCPGDYLKLDITADGTIAALDTKTKNICAPERSNGFIGGNGGSGSQIDLNSWRDRSFHGL